MYCFGSEQKADAGRVEGGAYHSSLPVLQEVHSWTASSPTQYNEKRSGGSVARVSV